jgi:hypothetical protein
MLQLTHGSLWAETPGDLYLKSARQVQGLRKSADSMIFSALSFSGTSL